MNPISLFITSILTSNLVLTKFLGVCPFIGTSKKTSDAVGMGISVTIVLFISNFMTYFIYTYLLIPTKTTYLTTILFLLIISSVVQALEIILKKHYFFLHQSLGIYLPLIATNCAILGTMLLNINNNYNLLDSSLYSIGSGVGFLLVIYIFASIRERLDTADVPKNFKGVPIALITAGIMALIFARYIGG